MKMFYCVFLLAVFLCTLDNISACDINALCQEHESLMPFIAHPSTCSKSFKCKNGEAVIYNCPNGEEFSEELQKCVTSGNGNCDARNKECSQSDYNSSVCDPKKFCDEYELVMPFIAHPHDCTKSYKCKNGEAVLFHCPSGLEFSEMLQKCVEAGESTCKSTCT
ncbi:chondroitin proteoglycan-2-like [Onthophagus taurus]|uniref:chondroitin proteoglycan-2-like n=1 Tax=Onthophagus taurus TaxID=166361 RepID=UPI0039BE22BD